MLGVHAASLWMMPERSCGSTAHGAQTSLAHGSSQERIITDIPVFSSKRGFSDLSEQEVLALAISAEEDDGRIYLTYAQHLRQDFPQSAKIFEDMAKEEEGHRQRLIGLHQQRFGDVIPLIRREHVAGFYHRKPNWLMQNLGVERIR